MTRPPLRCRSGHCLGATTPDIYWRGGKCKACRWRESRPKKPTVVERLRRAVESL